MGRNRMSGTRRAFTLIEILIVVIILGVLASMIVAQVVVAQKDTREAALRENLRVIRTQLVVYLQMHVHPAGLDGNGNLVSAAAFRTQMTQYTNLAGASARNWDANHTIRPCLSHFPRNPITDRDDVLIVGPDAEMVPDDSTGWLFKPDTQEFSPNSTEYGPGGKNW